MHCIHYHLGAVYAAMGEPGRARQHFQQQLALFPGTRDTRRAEAALSRLEHPTDGTPPMTSTPR